MLLLAIFISDYRFWILLSYLGDERTHLVISMAIYVFLDPYFGYILVTSLLTSASINIILKHLYALPRPSTAYQVVPVQSYGFPSGHAQLTTTIWSLLLWIAMKKFRLDTKMKTLLWILVATMIISVSTSRVMLGVHYIRDVVGGFVFGLTIALTS